MVRQSDGKLLVGGGVDYGEFGEDHAWAVIRYNADGTFDDMFGNINVPPTPGNTSFARVDCNPDAASFNCASLRALAIQSDGKIVLAGLFITNAGSDFMLARLNADGTLDTSFGTNGLVKTDFFGKDDDAYSVVIQSNGKIVAGGFATAPGTPSDFALVRYNTDGR